MSPTRLSNYGPGRGPRARPMGRPGTTRNSNGPGQPEIQTIRAFFGLGLGRAARMYTYTREGYAWGAIGRVTSAGKRRTRRSRGAVGRAEGNIIHEEASKKRVMD
jgi:hypothetical protein